MCPRFTHWYFSSCSSHRDKLVVSLSMIYFYQLKVLHYVSGSPWETLSTDVGCGDQISLILSWVNNAEETYPISKSDRDLIMRSFFRPRGALSLLHGFVLQVVMNWPVCCSFSEACLCTQLHLHTFVTEEVFSILSSRNKSSLSRNLSKFEALLWGSAEYSQSLQTLPSLILLQCFSQISLNWRYPLWKCWWGEKGMKKKERRQWAPAMTSHRRTRNKQTEPWHAGPHCLSSRGFDSSPARLSENRRWGTDGASPLIPMSALMTKAHFLMCPTCPHDVFPAGLVCTVVKKEWMTPSFVLRDLIPPHLSSLKFGAINTPLSGRLYPDTIQTEVTPARKIL